MSEEVGIGKVREGFAARLDAMAGKKVPEVKTVKPVPEATLAGSAETGEDPKKKLSLKDKVIGVAIATVLTGGGIIGGMGNDRPDGEPQ